MGDGKWAPRASADIIVEETRAGNRAHHKPVTGSYFKEGRMVITLDKKKKPLGYCTPRRARILISKGRACVYRYYPFTVVIKDRLAEDARPAHDYRIKIDPGAKDTGIAVTEGDRVVLFAQIRHRGQEVKAALDTRRSTRRNRRSRETRYRRRKYKNGLPAETGREDGRLPPSVESVADNVINWAKKLQRLLGPCGVTVETAKFDTQLMENPGIEGAQYQQGTLMGYEVREYLLEKYQHTCQYCAGMSGDKRLEWEHMRPSSRGGSDSVKNATLACHTCNQDKDDLTPEEYLEKLEKRFRESGSELDGGRVKCTKRVIEGKPNGLGLRYAAWVNSARKYMLRGLSSLAGTKSLEVTTGGRTKYNRHVLGVRKDHHLDAMCMGAYVPEGGYKDAGQPCLYITAKGRGSRFRGNVNSCGIITTKYKDRAKRFMGFQTGDIVRAVVPGGRHEGRHAGRVTIRKRPSFRLRTTEGKVFDVNPRHLKLLQPADGYAYRYG